MSEELAAALAGRLRDAHRRVAALELPDDEKARTARRLLAITDASKHDLARASARLDQLLADLDARPSSGSGVEQPGKPPATQEVPTLRSL